MRVARPTYTKDGRRRKSTRYHVHIKVRGEWRRLPAFALRGPSETLGRRIEKLAALRAAGEAPDEELAGWLEGIDAELAEKLRGWGLLAEHRVRAIAEPLEDHARDYRDYLLAKGDVKDHVRTQYTRILKVLRGTSAKLWPELNSGAIERWLAGQRESGMSTRTSNFHAAVMRSFCRWMVDDGRAGTTPLRRLKGVPVTDEEERGAFTVEQVQKLIDVTAKSAKVRSTMDGMTRARLYMLAVESGLRAGAIASLTRDSFRFTDDGGAVVTVEAGQQKNRRKHRVPLRPSLAAPACPAAGTDAGGPTAVPSAPRSRGDHTAGRHAGGRAPRVRRRGPQAHLPLVPTHDGDVAVRAGRRLEGSPVHPRTPHVRHDRGPLHACAA